jgi:biopolymer transport protein ExbD
MYFERQIRRTRPIPLTSLIDVMFFLLLFFMLSTSFVRTESLELTLPGNSPMLAQPLPSDKPIQVYLTKDGVIYMDQQQISTETLTQKLRDIFQIRPERSILLLNGEGVTVQQMINIMDRIYLSGGKNLSVESWQPQAAEEAAS